MKNRNIYIDRELLGAVIGGGAVLLIIGYLVLSWFGIVFQQRVIIPLIVLLAFVLVLIVSSLNRLDTINYNYCFDYINHIREKKINNTIIQSNVVYYIEQLIKDKRVIDAANLLSAAKDILSVTDIKLYSNILNKEYNECIVFIDALKPENELLKKRLNFWKKYCEIKKRNDDEDDCNKQINELFGESEYIKLIYSDIKRRKCLNICIIIIMGIFFIFGLYLLFSSLFISPIGNDSDKVFAKAFGLKVSDTSKIYDDGREEKTFKIYSSKDAVYYCLYEKKSNRFMIKHFMIRQKTLLNNSDFFDIEVMNVEDTMKKWGYDNDSIIFVFMDKITDVKTFDNKDLSLAKVVNGFDETFYVYSVHK